MMLLLPSIIVLHCDTVFVCVCAVIYYGQDLYSTLHLQSFVKSFKEPLLYCLRQVSESSCLNFITDTSATQGVLNDWPKTTWICGKPGNRSQEFLASSPVLRLSCLKIVQRCVTLNFELLCRFLFCKIKLFVLCFIVPCFTAFMELFI